MRNLGLSVGLITSSLIDIQNSGYSVYPNPSNGLLTIETSSEGELLIYNAIGQVVQSIILTKNKNEIKIDTDGIYILKFRDKLNNFMTNRIVVIK